MPRADRSTDTDKRRADAIATGDHQKGGPRPPGPSRAWTTANKLHGGGKKVDSRSKVPSGPLGGSGRKTNLSRSS
jgi:hypothetical protein